MSLRVQRSDWFIGDIEHYAAWYDREAGWDLAERYLRAVASTLAKLASIPTLGHITSFDHPELHGLRCMQVDRPFERHLIFYRYDELSLYAERAVPGARDLSRRLTQEPGFEGE